MKIALYAREIEQRWHNRFCFIINNLAEKGAVLNYYRPLYDRLRHTYNLDVPAGECFESASELPGDTDLFLCMGGDGTFLESLQLVKSRIIPVAGVNFGRLGFLAGADDETGTEWIDDFFEKRFFIEKRMLFEVTADFLPENFYPFALNEVAIQRQDPLMVAVNVKVDGKELPTYWSDGLVLATPTGSTAYSMSIGGPIMFPGVKAMILAPIAPHNLNIRPLVLPEVSEIEISVNARVSPAILSLDNRSLTIPNGKSIMVRRADYDLNYLSFRENKFIDGLRRKLLWGEDKRNS
jgi:NAD+ kinase